MDAHAIQRELAQELLPLAIAADALCQRAYSGERQQGQLWDMRRDLMAAAIASLVPIYAYDPKRPGKVRRVNRALVAHGRFRNGGAVFEYPNGRGRLASLAVKKHSIDDVFALITRQGSRSLIGDTMALRATAEALCEQAQDLVRAASQASERSVRLRREASAVLADAHAGRARRFRAVGSRGRVIRKKADSPYPRGWTTDWMR